MDQLLEVKSLRTEFITEEGRNPAVKDVSFILRKGETLGIVGESGSGKSVTSLSVMRLISSPGIISAGEIFYNSREKGRVNLLGLKENEMRSFRGNEIAMIFQEPMTSLNPVFTCGDQVAEALILHKKLSKKEAKLQTIALFEKVELPRPNQMFSAYPHQISGGQKQRVMIAMAMSCSPQILIADEPTTALDVTVQARILELMRNLQEENGMGLLFITHDLGVIAEIADRVMVMYKGRVVEEGNVEDIFSNPRHPYTKGLLACRPPLTKRLHTLPTISDFMKEEADGSFTEIKRTLSEALHATEISPAETRLRHEELYKQKPILKVENLKTWFPVSKGLFGRVSEYIRAVDDVSFDVYPGETLGLVGESGCGKTTLGRTIIRLIEPTHGKVIFREKDFASLDGSTLRKMRKHIQIIFQDPYSSLNPRMTVGNAIFEPMTVHHLHPNNAVRKEKVMELLERVGLKQEHFDRYPHEFSGGQRQRVCIARALSLEPEFIICDESVSALDVSIQAQVLNLLNELKRDFGFTYIFISHDLSVVKFMSDRMIVMNKGKIEEMGNPDDIYASPKSDYTKRLIAAIPASQPDRSFLKKRPSVSE
ncbi:MAG: ABC transporter ATP-binding protein [Bacteroidetes bacterium]|nr:MAG: ABC transporter ATP-binding protein [Bacteroidota bacterium]